MHNLSFFDELADTRQFGREVMVAVLCFASLKHVQTTVFSVSSHERVEPTERQRKTRMDFYYINNYRYAGVQYHEQDEQQDLHFTDLKIISSVTCSYGGAGHQFKTAAP